MSCLLVVGCFLVVTTIVLPVSLLGIDILAL